MTPLDEELLRGTQFMAPTAPKRCAFSLDRSATVRHETKRFVGAPDATVARLGEPGGMRGKLIADREVVHGGTPLPTPG